MVSLSISQRSDALWRRGGTAQGFIVVFTDWELYWDNQSEARTDPTDLCVQLSFYSEQLYLLVVVK